VRRLPDDDALPLFAAAAAPELAPEPEAHLPAMVLGEHVAADYQTVRLSLKGHPMGVLRPVFAAERFLTAAGTGALKDGARARMAGVVLVRQRPGNGNAIFVTLEDETGIVNVVLWARLFERFRREVMGARLMAVQGRVQKSAEGVVHLMALTVTDRTSELARLSDTHDTEPPLARADEVIRPQEPRGPEGGTGYIRASHPRQVRVLPKSRDFH
jgi:error-prone DNA polymerase